MLRRLLLVSALAFGVTAVAPAALEVPAAEAGPAAKPRPAAKAKAKPKAKAKAKAKATSGKAAAKRTARGGKKKSAKVKLCSTKGTGKKARRSCSFVKEFQGHGVARAKLRTEPLPRPSGAIWLQTPNFREEVQVNIYREDGSFDDEALAALDELFRCKRTGETRAVDPRLYEQLSRISDHFGGKQIELVSGFRFAERDSSRHFHASAMDIRIKGVSIREMYDFAESLDGGGMGIGIYPRSGFIHVDYRAPGDPSYRWTDYSGPGSGSGKKRGKKPGRTAPAKRPTS
ncbi:MAG: YcbK family protein [Kofleriaceae bacterium]|nr:YcbK family protein [Kofleriaceae bacterium]MCL4228852.1 DUF882 domain-containing protein [Myxococcales bacterium]